MLVKNNLECLMKVAKRINNPKRHYVLINPYQAKHIPVSPHKAVAMMCTFAENIAKADNYGNTLVIGFAETATAIGCILAKNIGDNCRYIHTTREDLDHNPEYIYFSEEHSHATEQKLCINDFCDFIKQIDSVVLVDDEITTGKTIINLVTVLKDKFPSLCNSRFFAVSIINRMNQEQLNLFNEYGIKAEWLYKVDFNDYEEYTSSVKSNSDIKDFRVNNQDRTTEITYESGKMSPRCILRINDYYQSCQRLCDRIISRCDLKRYKSVLVLGTEEFMFPAIMLGYIIEDINPGIEVLCHSTTRSPILPSDKPGYPIFEQNIVASFYDSSRITFIYNLMKYDKVFILSDSSANIPSALSTLANALNKHNSNNVEMIIWGQENANNI